MSELAARSRHAGGRFFSQQRDASRSQLEGALKGSKSLKIHSPQLRGGGTQISRSLAVAARSRGADCSFNQPSPENKDTPESSALKRTPAAIGAAAASRTRNAPRTTSGSL